MNLVRMYRGKTSRLNWGYEMAYAIRFRPSAARAMRKLPRAAQERIAPRIEALGENPRPPDAEKLTGQQSGYRIRAGEYRILYEVRDAVFIVTIMKIGHRREVYRQTP